MAGMLLFAIIAGVTVAVLNHYNKKKNPDAKEVDVFDLKVVGIVIVVVMILALIMDAAG